MLKCSHYISSNYSEGNNPRYIKRFSCKILYMTWVIKNWKVPKYLTS